jgi:hypothetical protein
MLMSIEKFDPYGSALPADSRDEAERRPAASVVLTRLGQYVFWLLVILVVACRIAFFSTNLPFQFVDVPGTTSGIAR